MTPFFSRSLTAGFVLASLLIPLGTAFAQSDAKTLIAQAYQKTKKAKTVDELTTGSVSIPIER